MRIKNKSCLHDVFRLFYRETPLFRWITRGGGGRKRMQKYRKSKGIRRPRFACAQQMLKGDR